MPDNVNLHGPTIGPPQWAADGTGAEYLMRGPFKVTAAAFPTLDAVTVKLNGAAAAAATSLTVDALTGAVLAGTVLLFPNANPLLPGAIAVVAADAAATDTAISVVALEKAIADNAEAVVNGSGKRAIRSGTVVGRTIAERDAGTGFGQPASTDDEIRIVAFDIVDADANNDCELYKPGSLVYENFLANIAFVAATSALLDKLRATYICTLGAA